MRKGKIFVFNIVVLMGMVAFFSPLNSGVNPVNAQGLTQATPTVTPTPTTEPGVPDGDAISFSQLGLTDTFLYGPYDTMVINYSIPSDWALSEGVEIQLTVEPSFTPGIASSTNQSSIYSNGVLYVSYNGSAIFQLPLSWTGEKTLTFTIPTFALPSTRQDGRQEIRLFLNAGTDCHDNGRTDVIVKASSMVLLPHSYTTPSTDLSALPKPFYMRSSFASTPVVVVIPDKPTARELQAALTIFASFGRMSLGRLSLKLIEVSQATDDILQKSNLIFIGKADGLPQLTKVLLEGSSDGKTFSVAGSTLDDGIVEMAVSPWNKSNVVLVVGGNSDDAVVKAAQAVSSGTLRPGKSKNLTLVVNVLESIGVAPVAEDRTLSDLGYSSLTLSGIGLQSTDITFSVPAGQVAKEGSYLNLTYNHSGLVDNNSSGLSVYLNGEAIGSQNLSTDTQSDTSVQIYIPSDLVKQGVNSITIEVNLDPADNCSLFAQDNLWATFRSSSLLHLPLEEASSVVTTTTNLGNYPYPFISNPTLKTTTFVVSADVPASWAAAAQIAADLGMRSSGALVELNTIFADGVTSEVRQSQDLLIVGQASKLPIIFELGEKLPAPFEAGSDVATERAFRIVYNLPPGTTIGYLELIKSPWQADRTILAVLGSDADGLRMAASALTTPSLRSNLGGDFAVVNGSQILISDSRLQVGTGNISSTIIPGESTPEAISTQTLPGAVIPDSHPLWMVPAMIWTAGIILILLIGFGVIAFIRRKK